jgi:hypothetical protein
VPTDVLGVYLFKLAFPPEEIHLYFTLNEEIVILTDDPFSILVTDCNAEVDKISCIRDLVPFRMSLPCFVMSCIEIWRFLYLYIILGNYVRALIRYL